MVADKLFFEITMIKGEARPRKNRKREREKRREEEKQPLRKWNVCGLFCLSELGCLYAGN